MWRSLLSNASVIAWGSIASSGISAIVGVSVMSSAALSLYICELVFDWNAFSLVTNIPHIVEVMLLSNSVMSVAQILLLDTKRLIINHEPLSFDQNMTQEALQIGKITGIFGAIGSGLGYTFTMLIPSTFNLADLLLINKPAVFGILAGGILGPLVLLRLIYQGLACLAETAHSHEHTDGNTDLIAPLNSHSSGALPVFDDDPELSIKEVLSDNKQFLLSSYNQIVSNNKNNNVHSYDSFSPVSVFSIASP